MSKKFTIISILRASNCIKCILFSCTVHRLSVQLLPIQHEYHYCFTTAIIKFQMSLARFDICQETSSTFLVSSVGFLLRRLQCKAVPSGLSHVEHPKEQDNEDCLTQSHGQHNRRPLIWKAKMHLVIKSADNYKRYITNSVLTKLKKHQWNESIILSLLKL